ncbi:MAG: rod shape-determining protein MreD, partial [Dehalococcoidales bacterium]|nr:rod shape-determining protein MreD [Dehalococcoidales bacterium]
LPDFDVLHLVQIPHGELALAAAVDHALGAIWGAVGGLLLDLASIGPLGSSALALAAVGYLSGFGQDAALRVNRLLPLLAACTGTVVFDLFHMLLLQLSGWDFNWVIVIYEIVLPSSLLNVVVMPLVYGSVYWLERRLNPRAEIGW